MLSEVWPCCMGWVGVMRGCGCAGGVVGVSLNFTLGYVGIRTGL